MRSDFRVFDGHCDTLTLSGEKMMKSQLKASDMKQYKKYIQIFAVCCDDNPPFAFAKRHVESFERKMMRFGIEPVYDRETLAEARCGGILALEGADPLYGNMAALDMFYKKGVRLITVTWNNNNSAASSITSENDGGLTLFGKKMIKYCEKKGIVVDLSHIGDRGFSDICEITDMPVVCSHSNSRSVCSAARNITDWQFLELVRRGGVTGICFYGDFLGGKRDITSVISHIEHFCSLGGEKNIGIGSDFDGIERMPEDCTGALYTSEIAQYLLRLNYSEMTVRAILYDNFYRVFNNVFGRVK